MRTRLKIMKSMIAMKNILNLSLRGWLFAALLMTASASHAQKKQYPYLQDGKIIVCREGADGVKSSLIHPNWDSTPSHNELDAANNRFAAKFEVAASDVDTSATWDDAVNLCPSGWRLPTIRELRLIYVYRNELGTFDLSAMSTGYWSATESSSDSSNAWYVVFGSGETGGKYPKIANSRVRCIRGL